MELTRARTRTAPAIDFNKSTVRAKETQESDYADRDKYYLLGISKSDIQYIVHWPKKLSSGNFAPSGATGSSTIDKGSNQANLYSLGDQENDRSAPCPTASLAG